MNLMEVLIPCFGLIFLALLVQQYHVRPHRTTMNMEHDGNTKSTRTSAFHSSDFDLHSRTLNTTVCSDRCATGCRSYLTPIGICYNGRNMFDDDDEDDNPFGEQDIMDAFLPKDGSRIRQASGVFGSIQRVFYKSTDGSCSGEMSPDDSFQDLPLNHCIGPFGPPRPWGIMTLVEGSTGVIDSVKKSR